MTTSRPRHQLEDIQSIRTMLACHAQGPGGCAHPRLRRPGTPPRPDGAYPGHDPSFGSEVTPGLTFARTRVETGSRRLDQLAGNVKLTSTCWKAASKVPPGASSTSKVFPWRSKTTNTAPLAGPESITTIRSAAIPATLVWGTWLPSVRLASA